MPVGIWPTSEPCTKLAALVNVPVEATPQTQGGVFFYSHPNKIKEIFLYLGGNCFLCALLFIKDI